jgi:hypothetical protein
VTTATTKITVIYRRDQQLREKIEERAAHHRRVINK